MRWDLSVSVPSIKVTFSKTRAKIGKDRTPVGEGGRVLKMSYRMTIQGGSGRGVETVG